MSAEVTQRVFAAVDSFDPRAFAELLAADATVTFGNGEPLHGRQAIIAAIEQFFSTIGGLRHQVVNQWDAGADTVAETEVTYERLDGKSVTISAVSIWRVGDDGLIIDYRIYFDLTPVYAA